jgi:hypothetical protein
MPFRLRVIGLLLIVAVLATTIIYYDMTNILWLCNISSLLAGVALLSGKPQSALVGATFMLLGGISWLLNLVINHAFDERVSYVTHFSFAFAAIYLFFQIRVARYLWVGCFCWYILSQVLSRLFTPPAENVNLAFSIWRGWNIIFSNFFSFWCFISFSCLVFLFVMNKFIFSMQTTRRFIQLDRHT